MKIKIGYRQDDGTWKTIEREETPAELAAREERARKPRTKWRDEEDTRDLYN